MDNGLKECVLISINNCILAYMSNLLIALLCAASASAWTYNQFMRRTGSNTKQSVGGAAVTGVLTLILVIIILGALF